MMKKLIPVLIAGVFSAGAFAQAVTIKPGEAMGPTGTNSQATGAAKSAGTPIKGAQGSTTGAAVTTKPGEAMGPTTTSATNPGKTSGTAAARSDMRNDNKDSSPVTIQPGGAMGPTGATSAGPKK